MALELAFLQSSIFYVKSAKFLEHKHGKIIIFSNNFKTYRYMCVCVFYIYASFLADIWNFLMSDFSLFSFFLITYDSSSQSMFQRHRGSSRHFQGIYEVKNIFEIILKVRISFHCVDICTTSAKITLGRTTCTLAWIKIMTLKCSRNHYIFSLPHALIYFLKWLLYRFH